jgi:hypothetical protein
MRSTVTCRLSMTLAAATLACLGCSIAMGATVRSAGSEGMDRWYGRAGGVVGSDAVNQSPDWQKPGHPIAIGMPANSGRLYFNEGQGGFASDAHMRSNQNGVTVGLPANSGSLYFNEGQGGFLAKPHLRPDTTESAQPPSAIAPDNGSSGQH